MRRPRLVSLVLAAALIGSLTGCDTVDLKTIKVVDVISGYYDDGVIKEGPHSGWSHILPTITFKLQNAGTAPVSSVHLMVSFWAEGKDGELDSREVPGIGTDAVAPNGTGEPITIRSTVGFQLEAARTELFNQGGFVDWSAKIFAKRGGRIVPIGEFKIDRRLLPHERSANHP
jgi:hypothetical protein